MTPVRQTREFAQGELLAGFTYIACLPNHTRVLVEEWDDGRWRAVFDEDRDQAPGRLGLISRGARFRVSWSKRSSPQVRAWWALHSGQRLAKR